MLSVECWRLVLLTYFFATKWYTCCACSGLGPCPKLEGIRHFNLTRFSGHWYEIERSFYLMELISSCVSFNITETDKGRMTISVNSKITWTGSFSISEGVAAPTKKDPSIFIYKVSSRFPRLVNRYLPGAGMYQIFKTDYDNYAIIYSCTDFEIVHSDKIWIWGRKKEMDVGLRAELYEILDDNGLDSERLILSKNTNCTDY